MIKKAVLPLLTAPFLMVFSEHSYSFEMPASLVTSKSSSYFVNNPPESCEWDRHTNHGNGYLPSRLESKLKNTARPLVVYVYKVVKRTTDELTYYGYLTLDNCPGADLRSMYPGEPISAVPMSDDDCSNSDGSTYSTTDPAIGNYLMAGGSVRTNGGACSVSANGGVSQCVGEGDSYACEFAITSVSTGDETRLGVGVPGGLASTTNPPTDNLDPPDYLNALPGQCSTPSSCVTIDDISYLVDWETAPDWFSYVGSDGQTYSKPQPDPTDPGDGNDSGNNGGGDTGGGSDGDNDAGGSTGGGSSGGSGDNDSGNDSGGSTGGGSSGGGSTGGGSSGGGDSTGGGDSSGGGSSDSGDSGSGDGSSVPDFEFDESGIIEAIGSAGEANQDALDAVSNDITNAIGEQTEETKGLFDGLGDTITNALGLGTCYPDSDAATSDKGLLGCIQNIANGMVNNFVERLTNTDGMPSGDDVEGMIDGEGTVDSLMDSLDQGAEEQKDTIYQEFEGTFESGGIIDGTLSPLRDFVSSFLPRIPNGGCTPLVFGTGPHAFTIDCEGFNLLKAALSWVLFFFTAYQLISIPMDARKTQ